MVEVTRAKYPLNPTLKLVTPEGKATAEFFRILRAIGDLISNIEIEDGEVTADKIQVDSLEAISAVLGNVIVNGNLLVEGTITTGKVAQNAITEVSIGQQVGSGNPDGTTLCSAIVPVTSTSNTGVIVTFTAVQGLPVVNAANFGSWRVRLKRNGVMIASTGDIYYDDNFANLIAVQFVDANPGTNPTYEIYASTISGPGDFSISSGVLNGALFKR
jgi:hypothetical protein